MSGSSVPRDASKRATVSAAAIFVPCVLLRPAPSSENLGLPAARTVTAAARSPALQPAASSRRRAQLDARARVCLRGYLPLHHFGSREEPGPGRPAAEWLPVHTLPALFPPTPPLLLLALSSSLCSSSSGRSCACRAAGRPRGKGREGKGWGKECRCLWLGRGRKHRSP